MKFQPVPLEDWMRGYYFDAAYDLGSSGVENFSLGEMRALLGFDLEALDPLVFNDSETLGAAGLRAAIAEKLGNGDPAGVMVGNGSNEVSFYIMNSLLEPGDEVVVIDPIYHTWQNIPIVRQCRMKPIPLSPERDFRPDMDALLDAIGPATKMVVTNFPHNPTGISLTPEEQRALVDKAASVGAYLLWDGALEELVHRGDPLPNPVGFYDRALSIGTLSKCYGLAGMRLGWCIADPQLLEGSLVLKDYTSLYVSPLVEWLSQKAIEGKNKLLAARLPQVKANLAHLQQFMTEMGDRVSWVRPWGGVTAFVEIIGVGDTDPFCRALAEQCGVMMVPGSCFKHRRHVRLGFGGPRAEFREGLARFGEFLKNYRGSEPRTDRQSVGGAVR